MVVCGEPDVASLSDPTVDRITLGANRARAVVGASRMYRRLIAAGDVAGVRWHIEALDGALITARPGDEVLGIADVGTDDDRVRLVVLAPDRRAVVALGAREAKTLVTLSAPVVGAAVSPRGTELAVVTAGGALRVYALPTMHALVARGVVEAQT